MSSQLKLSITHIVYAASILTIGGVIVELVLSRHRERSLIRRVDDLDEELYGHLLMNEWRGATGRETECAILPLERRMRVVPTPRDDGDTRRQSPEAGRR